MLLIRIGCSVDGLAKVIRMTVLSGIRVKRISAASLSVILLAWISVVAAQCEIADVSAATGHIELNGQGSQYACVHAASAPSAARSECCCTPTTVVNGDGLKLPKAAMLILIATDPGFVDLAIISEPKLKNRHLPVDGRFLPVYLVTQRLRI